jgi:hypothetical protein
VGKEYWWLFAWPAYSGTSACRQALPRFSAI